MYKRKGFFVGKRGISVMVGYVLLIVFVIIIGGIVYQWLKTYIPAQALECPDGVSLFIKEATFNPSDSRLTVTLKNNGRFNLAGYFIHATNSSDQELPIIDLSGYLNEASPGMKLGNSVLFLVGGISEETNLFEPGFENSYFFDIPPEIGEPNLIRITPARYQDVDEKERFVSCSNARVTQAVGEPVVDGGGGEPPGGEISESIVFVSSTLQDGKLGGISGADDICNELASNANLQNSGEEHFKAWLSDSTHDAKDIIGIIDIPFKLVEGTVIANRLADLLDGSVQNKIHKYEDGTELTDEKHVWTYTKPDGNKKDDGKHCNNWESDLHSQRGHKGDSDRIDTRWAQDGDKECDKEMRLYCFQVS